MASRSCIPKFVKKEITDLWVGETLKLMLLKDTFTPNEATQQYISSVSAHEIAATTGYALGGVTIAGKVSVEHIAGTKYNYYLDSTIDQVIGTGASLNYMFGVVYKDTGNPATSPIRAIIDFETNQIVSNGTSTIEWNALGIIYVS